MVTGAAGPTEPGYADPISDPKALDARTDRSDAADDLMARYERHGGMRELAVDDV